MIKDVNFTENRLGQCNFSTYVDDFWLNFCFIWSCRMKERTECIAIGANGMADAWQA